MIKNPLRTLWFYRFETTSFIGIRGSCDGLDNIIDSGFLLDVDTIKRNVDKGIEFVGYTKTKLVLDKETNRWSVISLKDGSKIMSLDSEVGADTNIFLLKHDTPQKKRARFE